VCCWTAGSRPLAGKERERSREEETVEPWKVTEHQEEKERIFFNKEKRDGRERRRRDRFLCPRPTKLEEQGQRVPTFVINLYISFYLI
jgi:hypothetical protein